MKFTLPITLLLSLASTPAFAAWDGTSAQWTKGDGTEANPFLIENEQQLSFLQKQVTAGESYSGKYFRLESNLDMGANNGHTFNPIGFHDVYTLDGVGHDDSKPFLGTFDGNYKTIDNVRIALAAPDPNEIGGVGLFATGKESTVIKNVVLGANATVDGTGSVDVGGIIGTSYAAKIYNCMNSGTIIGGGVETGGIVGFAYTGTTIDGCINNGTINAHSFTGGIAGSTENTDIKNCYSTGTITADGAFYIAGIVSWANKSTKVSNCYSISKLNGQIGSSYSPGISPVVADLENSKAANCYYVKALTGCDALKPQSGITAISEADLKSEATVNALNNENPDTPWIMGNDGLPTLAWVSKISAGVNTVATDSEIAEIHVDGNMITATCAHTGAIFTIYDMAGHVVYSTPVTGNQAGYAPAAGAVYIAVVVTPEGRIVRKISL